MGHLRTFLAFALLLGSCLRRCPSEIEDMRSRAALLHPTLHTAATYISTQQIMQFGPQIESVRSRVDVLSIPKLLLQPFFY